MSSSVLDSFQEKVGSGNESIDMLNGKFTVTRIFQGPYLNRIKFTKTFLNQTATGTVFGGTVRFPFQEHPKHKGLFATSAEIKGVLGADITASLGIIKYKTAIITIKYQALSFKQPKDGGSSDNENKGLFDFIEETSDSSVEILQIPGEDIECDDKKQFDQGPQNHIQVFLNINIRQPFVARPHWGQIMDNLGKVNRNLFFTPGGKVAKAGTVRYDGPSDRIKIDALGPQNLLWDISHKFVYNRVGWHFKWCEGGFKELNKHIFEDGDLMAIFFGDEGGPIKDDLDAIQVAENNLQDKKVELAEAITAGASDKAIENIERSIRILTVQRNQLIADQGGTFLDQEVQLND